VRKERSFLGRCCEVRWRNKSEPWESMLRRNGESGTLTKRTWSRTETYLSELLFLSRGNDYSDSSHHFLLPLEPLNLYMIPLDLLSLCC